MSAKRGNYIADGEPRRVGISQHPRGEGTQPALLLPGRMRLRRCGVDERADSALGLDDPGAFELRVDARDRVGVDLEIHRKLADGRQLITLAKAASGNRRAQSALELRVDGRGVVCVDGDNARPDLHYSTVILD